jgi:hypothetical protein
MERQRECDCKVEVAIIKNDIKNIERWQEQQDKRLDRLEEADNTFQREATNNEKQRFGIWVTVVLGLGTALISAILTFLFSKF